MDESLPEMDGNGENQELKMTIKEGHRFSKLIYKLIYITTFTKLDYVLTSLDSWCLFTTIVKSIWTAAK